MSYSLSIRPFGGDNAFLNIGHCTAIAITLSNGHKIYLGDVDAVFDLQMSDVDKQLLADMKIKV